MKHPGVQKIIDHLEKLEGTEEDPDIECGFDMNWEAGTRFESKHPCGSACCIGGHAALLLYGGDGVINEDTSSSLAQLCDISLRDADRLCWPGRRYAFDYTFVTLDDALRVLRHYRDTGEVDWQFVEDRYLDGHE